jgi:hypothetical protein
VRTDQTEPQPLALKQISEALPAETGHCPSDPSCSLSSPAADYCNNRAETQSLFLLCLSTCGKGKYSYCTIHAIHYSQLNKSQRTPVCQLSKHEQNRMIQHSFRGHLLQLFRSIFFTCGVKPFVPQNFKLCMTPFCAVEMKSSQTLSLALGGLCCRRTPDYQSVAAQYWPSASCAPQLLDHVGHRWTELHPAPAVNIDT